jgi:hypothetical protein
MNQQDWAKEIEELKATLRKLLREHEEYVAKKPTAAPDLTSMRQWVDICGLCDHINRLKVLMDLDQ